jgi:hypothetical protein
MTGSAEDGQEVKHVLIWVTATLGVVAGLATFGYLMLIIAAEIAEVAL